MSRLSRCFGVTLLIAGPAFAQNVVVTLPAPPLPTIHVVTPQPVVVVPAPVVVEQRTVVVQAPAPGKGNRGKHKGWNK